MVNVIPGKLFKNNEKTVLECNKGFLYERFVYAMYPNTTYLINYQILESSKYTEDSTFILRSDSVKFRVCLELYAANKTWIDKNNFTLWDGKIIKESKKRVKLHK